MKKKMNITKLASEVYQACYEYRNSDGRIKVSKRDDGRFDIYHSYGSNDVIAYPGDSAQQAFNRVIFSIDLREIDWNKPLKKYLKQELREIKKEQQEEKQKEKESLAAVTAEQ